MFINSLKKSPDLAVIGSSRSLLINSDHFPGQYLINSSVNGASVQDHIALYQMYKSAGILPKKVIPVRGPWIFNRNNKQDRWQRLSYEFKRFFNPREPHPKPGFWESFSLEYYRSKLEALLSPSYFQHSLKGRASAPSPQPPPPRRRQSFE